MEEVSNRTRSKWWQHDMLEDIENFDMLVDEEVQAKPAMQETPFMQSRWQDNQDEQILSVR